MRELIAQAEALEADLAAAQSTNESWIKTVREIGHAVNCLYSTFPDANGHIVSAIQKLKADLAAAQSYATTLAVSMHRQHYAEAAPNWQPLPDLAGLLTQIDNMYAGLRNDLEAALVENKRLVGANLATLRADLAAAQAERDALFRSKSTLNTRVLAAEAEVQALRVAHKAAIAEAVAKERVRVMLAIADEFCGYDDMAETLRERARGVA